MRLQTLHDERQRHTGAAPSSEGVLAESAESDVPTEDLEEIELNTDVPEVFANIVIKEQSNITIHSNRKRNPLSDGYDMKVPPATYEKAMLHPD